MTQKESCQPSSTFLEAGHITAAQALSPVQGGWKERAGELRASLGFPFIRDVGGAKSLGPGCWEVDNDC